MSSQNKRVYIEDIPSTDKLLEFVLIDGISRKTYDKYNRRELKTTFTIKHNLNSQPNLFNIKTEFESELNRLIRNLIDNAENDDYVAISIINSQLETPIFISPVTVNSFNVKTVFERIKRIAQSYKSFLGTGVFEIMVALTKLPRGGGKKDKYKCPKTSEEIYRNKRSIIIIKNNDNSCAFRALYIAKYRVDNRNNLNINEWKLIIDSRYVKTIDMCY